MKGLCLFALLTLTLSVVTNAQDNRKCVETKSLKTTLSGFVDPGSIELSDSLMYTFDQRTHTLKLYSAPDSVLTICYRVLAISDSTYAHRKLDVYDSLMPFTSEPGLILQKERLFETGDVQTTGRLTRGFTMGTNQDVFVNSAMNLTLDGQLTDGLKIQATINDQTIPFQPEGNTAQLQDLDRVFMRIYNDELEVRAGDIQLRNTKSHFLRYNKNVQGGLLSYNGTSSETFAGASVAKGKFASVAIQALEGVMGPYRIPGPQGQDFVVVLANSERVFVDGKRMQRGFNLDYTIDYNLGEVTFTSRVVITQFSRIRVDFEYADNTYSRFIMAAGHRQKFGIADVGVHIYSEKDQKNSPNFDLSQEDKLQLAAAGNDPVKAIKSSADSVGFDLSRILYKKIRQSGQDVFVYSTNPDSAHWQVSFTRIGPQRGSYRQKQTSTNGRVFEWVPELNGVPQGDYIPYSVIPAPTKKQMVEFETGIQVSEHERVEMTLALSNVDQNQFSDLDNENNQGHALRFNFLSEGRDLGKLWKLQSSTSVEMLSATFKPVDRFRPVEFDRDWSAFPRPLDSLSNDVLVKVGVTARKNSTNFINYEFANRRKQYVVDGDQHQLDLSKDLGKFRILGSMFSSQNQLEKQDANWNRYRMDASYLLGGIRIGQRIVQERNVSMLSDSITYSANYFTELDSYVQSEAGKEASFFGSFRIRETSQPLEGQMVASNTSRTLQMGYQQDFTSHNLAFTLTNRTLDNKGESVDFGSGQSLNSRVDWLAMFFDRNIKSDLTWSVSNSRELRKEFIFVRVPTGQGNYTWVDYNGDGIEDLNEFNLAVNIDERNYAKIFVPTSEYIEAFENTFNYRFRLQFPRAWRTAGGLKTLLSRISNNTSWTSQSKFTDPSLDSRLFAFVKTIDRSSLLSMRENIRTTWFFNRTNPVYGITGGYQQNRFLNLLTGGFEDRQVRESHLNARMNLGKPYSVKIETRIGKELSASDFLHDRNFTIDTRRVRPSFHWQPTPAFRAIVGYGLVNRGTNGNIETATTAFTNEIFTELKMAVVSKNNLQARVTFSNVDFTGTATTPVGYAVLRGLQPGENVQWSVNWQQTLVNGLQLSMIYHGRKATASRVIHTGNVSVSALF